MDEDELKEELSKTREALLAVQQTCKHLEAAVNGLTFAVRAETALSKSIVASLCPIPKPQAEPSVAAGPVYTGPDMGPTPSATWPMNAEGTGYTANPDMPPLAKVKPPPPSPDLWWATLAAELEALHKDYTLTWESLSFWLGIQADVWHGLKAPGPDQLRAAAREEYGWSQKNWKWTRWMSEGRAARTMKAIASMRATAPPSAFATRAKPTACDSSAVNPDNAIEN